MAGEVPKIDKIGPVDRGNPPVERSELVEVQKMPDEWKGGISKKGSICMREQVEKALESIRPMLQMDGGDVELVDVADGIVKVKLTGSCGHCPMAQMTLQQGVERAIKEHVPDVRRVEAVLG